MSNKVYTYTKITELKKADYFAEIAAIPQIVMSMEMATNMAYDMRIFKNNIMGFSAFVKRLFPSWNTSGQRFLYITVLNNFLRKKIAVTENKHEKEWLFGCKKNLHAAISNIIRLEEAGVHPEDVVDDDRDIMLFLEMWKTLETADSSIKDFRERLRALKTADVFEQEVNKIFRFHGHKKIVWHGFQFLTPIQQFTYDCFKNAGYDIYALISNDKRYPYANEIWDYLYTTENGFPKKSDWVWQETATKNPLGEIFETGEKTTAHNVRIIKYANTIEFVEDVPRIKDAGYYMYCADDKTANAMLKNYFPERYEVRNLLAYPIGQFLYTLHKMWNEERQEIVLDQTGLRKCFAAGWLSFDGISSTNYTEDLERLLPYFDGCYSVDSWRERVGVFIEVYENALDVFSEEAEMEHEYKRSHEIMGNPLKNFSPFSIKDSRIDAVLSIIKELIQMAKSLFGKNEPISIQEHMSKLDALLYMQDGMPKELYLEEREKIKRIFEALESEKIRDFLCYPGDLATALLSFMNDKLEDDDENNRGLQTLVFNLFQIQAAPISTKGKIHLCLSDIAKLPGATGKYNWPLDKEVLSHVAENKPDTYINNWISNNEMVSLSNRYYTYKALENAEVEISWIQKQGEKLFAPSPYITLLDKLSNAKIQECDVRTLDLQYVSNVSAKRRNDSGFTMQDNEELHFSDKELEYSVCPMRFVYSYVLGDAPSYRNEYQINVALIRFIQVLGKLLKGKYTMEQVAEQVFELFPNIRKAEKRQILDDAMRWPLPDKSGNYTEHGNFKYTNHRYSLKFLESYTYQEAIRNMAMLMSQDGRKGIFHMPRGEQGAKNCEFCPHAIYCRKSLFGVDYIGD